MILFGLLLLILWVSIWLENSFIRWGLWCDLGILVLRELGIQVFS